MPNTNISKVIEGQFQQNLLDLTSAPGSNQKFSDADNKVNFDNELLETIAIELRNRANIYKNYKKEELGEDDLAFISTPHPIGNLSAKHGILLDWISRINNISLREELSKDETLYPDEKDRAKYQNPDYRKTQLEKFKKEIIRESLVQESQISDSTTLEELQKILINQFVAIGIDIKVIEKSRQSRDADAKIAHLEDTSRVNKIDDKNWDRADGDGDPQNAITEILGTNIRGKRLSEIYALRENAQNPNIAFEPRISSDLKRGVRSVFSQLHIIPGSNSINNIHNLFDRDKFNKAYNDYREFLEKQIYPTQVREGEFEINSRLDFILRATLPNFTNASGLVLSDFPEKNGEKILSRLLFLKMATEKFLQENDKSFEAKPQKFLPLCEDENSINNLKNLIKGILNEVLIQANNIKNDKSKSPEKQQEKLMQLKETLSSNGEFVFGAFFGPSDLTADMGGLSVAVINNKRLELKDLYQEFQEIIEPLVSFQDVTLITEYGKGSSPRRGANYSPGHDSRTNQGQTPAAHNTFLQKTYSKSSSQNSSYVIIPKEVQDSAIANHRSFMWNEEGKLGSVGLNYNEILADNKGKKLMFPTTKDYSNNQGTRGKSGLVEFQNQRAIGLANLASYVGLLQSPALPFDNGKVKWDQESFKEFANHPAGSAIIITELYQFCNMDSLRAKALGFNEDVISKSEEYANAALKFLGESCGVKINPNISRVNNVNNIVIGLQESDLISSPYLKKRLSLFQEQVPVIEDLSTKLTNRVLKVSKQIKSEADEVNNPEQGNLDSERKQDYAAIGTYLNLIANFQLPVISSEIPNKSIEKAQADQLQQKNQIMSKL